MGRALALGKSLIILNKILTIWDSYFLSAVAFYSFLNIKFMAFFQL